MIAVILLPESSSPSAAAPQMYSTLQVIRALFAGAPVLPVLAEEDHAPQAAACFDEMLDRVAKGNVRGVVVGTTLNAFLRACGRIPMLLHPNNNERRLIIPVVCNFCNCAFCFPDYLASVLRPPPGLTYTRLPGPATPDLNTAPLVGPLCGGVDGGALPAEGRRPVPLTVCPDRHHFAVAMGMMDHLPHDALNVEWRRPAALGVVPVAVGTRRGVLQSKEPAPEDGSSGATEGSPSPNV